MNIWFDELIETFDRLLATYRELLETAKIKYHCLMSGHIAELEMLIYREKNQVEIAQLLEEKRQNVVNHYCQFYDIQEKNITVTSLISKTDNICREKICSCLDNLKHVIKELQEINQTNMTLIHYSLEITEDVMKIFCPSAYQYPVYQHTGKKQDSKFPKIFIDTEM